jgi:hypothetical protein
VLSATVVCRSIGFVPLGPRAGRVALAAALTGAAAGAGRGIGLPLVAWAALSCAAYAGLLFGLRVLGADDVRTLAPRPSALA